MNPTQAKPRRGLWIAVGLILLLSLAPILWQLLTSLKTTADITAIPNVYLPKQLTLEHYLSLFQRRPFLSYMLNSTFVAMASTLLCLLIGTPAAYALARLRLPAAQWVLTGILIVTLFPYILLFLGLLDNILQPLLGVFNTLIRTLFGF
jgi:multiple sugar transport system permease protein